MCSSDLKLVIDIDRHAHAGGVACALAQIPAVVDLAVHPTVSDDKWRPLALCASVLRQPNLIQLYTCTRIVGFDLRMCNR